MRYLLLIIIGILTAGGARGENMQTIVDRPITKEDVAAFMQYPDSFELSPLATTITVLQETELQNGAIDVRGIRMVMREADMVSTPTLAMVNEAQLQIEDGLTTGKALNNVILAENKDGWEEKGPRIAKRFENAFLGLWQFWRARHQFVEE